MAGETYLARCKRREAFQAGMAAGSFSLILGGVSQAAACDGNRYQIAPNDTPLPPGILPL